MKKSCLVALATMALVFGLAGCQSETNADTLVTTNAPEATVTVAPDPTKVPETEITATPEVNEVPVQTEPTKEPVPTQTLETTSTPKPTDVPEVTEVPEKTEAPKATEAPKETKAPKPTSTPVPTEVPVPTKVPEKEADSHNFLFSSRNDGTWEIIGIVGPYPKELIFPSEIIGVPVTKVSIGADNDNDGVYDEIKGIEKIIIPEGVTEIGYCAFFKCSDLKNVTISDSVTKIGDNAFAYCEKLTEVTVPSGVKEIGGGAFNICKEGNWDYSFRMYAEKGSYAAQWCFDNWCPVYNVANPSEELKAPEVQVETTPVPTQAPTLSTSELWQQKYEAGEFSKNTELADILYLMLTGGNYKGVLDLLKDDSIAEKVKPYLYREYVYDASSYKLVTSDGNFVGVHLPNDITSDGDRHAWYSAGFDGNDGFDCTGYGDREVVYYPKPYAGLWDYIWFDGETAYYSDGDTSSYTQDQCFTIWEF